MDGGVLAVTWGRSLSRCQIGRGTPRLAALPGE
jgi:hypothetical protein